MVSLLDIVVSNNHEYQHLATSLPILNQKINFSSGIYDFQTSANNLSVYQILIELILCHLLIGKPVIIISCLNKFPLNLLVNHPQYKPHYLSQITSYSTADTYSKLYSVISNLKNKSTAMIIIGNIYELLELYKLELSSTYEEMILKLQIERNNVLLENITRMKIDGTNQILPDLPPNSDLLRSPIIKFDKHILNLINILSNVCQNNIAFITGTLSTKFEPLVPKKLSSQSQSSVLTSFTSPVPSQTSSTSGRVVLTPYTYFDNYVNKQIIFYKDWYHNSPHFAKNHPLIDGKVVINRALLQLVYVIKIGTEKIYFDNNNHLYDELNNVDKYSGSFNLIDLMNNRDINHQPNRSDLYKAIQIASERLTKSQVIQEPILPPELSINTNLDSRDILETSTQVLKPTSLLDPKHSNSPAVSKEVLDSNVSDLQNHTNYSTSQESLSETNTNKSFLVSHNNGIIQIQFLKSQSTLKIDETQNLVVDGSDDDYLEFLLTRR